MRNRSIMTLVAGVLFAVGAFASPCSLPDNGLGTVDLPPACPDGFQGPMTVVGGLPPGSTLDIAAVLSDFSGVTRFPGGTLGGEVQLFDAYIHWDISGTGDLAGFQRNLAIPVHCEVHTGPRNPGDPVQEFAQEMYLMQGQLFGDPDFCELIVQAGTSVGLPSPGSCKLTLKPDGNFNVDSFFDITYQINFQGCPGSILDGMAGPTTETDRFQAGEPYFPTVDHNCQLLDNGTGTIDLPPACPDGYQGPMTIVDGLPPGTTLEIEATLTDHYNVWSSPGGTLGGEVQLFEAYLYWTITGTGDMTGFQRSLAIPVVCEVHTGPRNPGDPVQDFDQELIYLDGELYGDPDFCELWVRAGASAGLPSPGHTTLTRLPSGDYAVDSFFDITYEINFQGCPGSILDGMAGTTTGTDRFQAGEPYFPPVDHNCQLPDNGTGTIDLPPACPDGYQGPMAIVDGLPPGTTLEIEATLTDFYNELRTPGGTLGGEIQLFEAYLYWTITGTGDMTGFQRNLAIPVVCEVHTGPRNPGDPVQDFDQELVYLDGELYGDPDFCELWVRAGASAGLPSPGHTTLTRLPSGDYAVDSFFDITYEINFMGCPGSQLADLLGTTIGTERFQAGEPYVTAVRDLDAPRLVWLSQNDPNPFNPITTIAYEVPSSAGLVELNVYDARGKHIRTLVHGHFPAGRRTVNWDGRDGTGRQMAAGVYLYALRTARGVEVRKMALIK